MAEFFGPAVERRLWYHGWKRTCVRALLSSIEARAITAGKIDGRVATSSLDPRLR